MELAELVGLQEIAAVEANPTLQVTLSSGAYFVAAISARGVDLRPRSAAAHGWACRLLSRHCLRPLGEIQEEAGQHSLLVGAEAHGVLPGAPLIEDWTPCQVGPVLEHQGQVLRHPSPCRIRVQVTGPL